MNKTTIYEERSKKYIGYMLMGTIVFLLFSLIAIRVIDINKINSLPILKDLNSINIVIGIIAIPCCLLYYYMYRNNEFFILTLSYISIFIEYIYVNYIYVNYIGVNLELSQCLINFPFIFRIFLLTIAIFNDGKSVKRITENKKLSVIIALLLNIIIIYIEVKLGLNEFFHRKNPFIWNVFQINILVYYTVLLFLLAIRCIRKKEFIYTIFISTISIYSIRRVFYYSIYNNYKNNI